ncbi:MAG: transposase, partial [Pseudomonadota bacterium]
VHTVLTTPAHVNDVTQAHGLLQGQETVVLGDAGYQGVDRRPENAGRPVTWHVALRPGVRRALPNDELGRLRQRIERVKASLRAKVEHPFHVIKNLFRYRKTRYRGLAKNTAQVVTLFGLANLVLAGWRRRARDTLRAS